MIKFETQAPPFYQRSKQKSNWNANGLRVCTLIQSFTLYVCRRSFITHKTWFLLPLKWNTETHTAHSNHSRPKKIEIVFPFILILLYIKDTFLLFVGYVTRDALNFYYLPLLCRINSRFSEHDPQYLMWSKINNLRDEIISLRKNSLCFRYKQNWSRRLAGWLVWMLHESEYLSFFHPKSITDLVGGEKINQMPVATVTPTNNKFNYFGGIAEHH